MHKVVLVDDEHFVRKGVISLIDWEDCGFQVSAEADNGEDALEVIDNTKPDLVITDIRMPVLDGLELIRQLVEEKKSSAKFIILSGYNDFSYAQKAVRYGVCDFILKPLEKEELETTLKQLSTTLHEEKKLKEHNQKLIITNMFEDVLSGNITEHQKELSNFFQLERVKRMYYIIVEVNTCSTYHSDLKKVDVIKEYISDAIFEISNEKSIMIRDHELNRYGVFVTDQHLEKFANHIAGFVNELQTTLQHMLNKVVSIYVGQAVEHINDLNTSFETATKTMEYRYTQLENEPIIYDMVKDQTIIHSEITDEVFISLMEAIEENDSSNMRKKIDLMFEEFQEKLFAPESIQTTIKRCVHGVMKAIRSMEGNEQQLTKLQPILNLNNSSLTLLQLKELLIEFVEEASGYIFKLRKQNVKSDIHKIKNYIEQHYHKNISLKSIAHTFFMNPVYMGQLFKKTYGVYFKDFLLQIRVNESKKLLRQTNLRVYEIAEKVGFRSADYFVTQFEKMENMTPTDYRKSL
ncbi:response regulator [Halalkalibacter kiskunsagensis]|uniref:Response regulator n=1 Tax=Halalkalibacter kiskunsagensis TaxID=1548599 RepID=A0ABV6KGJ7_9BACI